MQIVLASSSQYRKKLLLPLIPSIQCVAPQVDESMKPSENVKDYVMRLAYEKAKTVAYNFNSALIIGSDQSAHLNNEIFTKPITFEKAQAQLKKCSGKQVTFHTGICVLNTSSQTHQTRCENYTVKFRKLSEIQIKNYLKKEMPYDCAGSFKVEGLGISLFEKLSGDDPNTLIGLPLIALTNMLKKEGVDILSL